jgi:tryptophan synthase beta chain
MNAESALLSSAGLVPDAAGHFGRFGGRFVPEALIAALDELDAAFRHAQADEAFQRRSWAPGSCSSART